MKTTEPAAFRIGLCDADVLVEVIDGNETVLDQLLFAPDEADSLALDLTKFASMARAKREGAAGSA